MIFLITTVFYFHFFPILEHERIIHERLLYIFIAAKGLSSTLFLISFEVRFVFEVKDLKMLILRGASILYNPTKNIITGRGVSLNKVGSFMILCYILHSLQLFY